MGPSWSGCSQSGAADGDTLRAVVTETAWLRGELRLTHLNYHLMMRRLLSPEQVAAYDMARGYSGDTRVSTGRASTAAERAITIDRP